MSLKNVKPTEEAKKVRPKTGPLPDGIVWKAAAIAIALGALACALLVLEGGSERYSALYLKEGTYASYVSGNRVSFTYGVTCYDDFRTDYYLKAFLGDNQVAAKQFYIEGRGSSIEDTLSFDVPPNTPYPVRVGLVLTDGEREYTAHYWLKGRA